MSKYLSDCCHSEITTRGGLSDFSSDKCEVTMWMECNKCHQPCNVFLNKRKTWEINPKTRIVPNKKRDIKLTKKEIAKILKEEDF